MKRNALLVFIILTTLMSCSVDEDNSYVGTEVMPIESIDIPDQFVYGESYEIMITYNRPSTCYQFYNFLYDINGNERTVAVINSVYSDSSCTEEEESVTVSLNFMVTGTETYLFKFYQGHDDEGEDQYYLAEVPVISERQGPESTVLD
ncbi:hypothetical protein [Winogradskyella psychrotolerans]|uniref:hypothetical protein n=1 Tax=Winogradskyella psychrotolerans TaxID=1344585 RepID=UPI001C07B2E2|nr:hypothetical protein [Winogradskyella psychrotolerans]MBU2926833.1 hypothetical protein [Winogradskyella psychrotolerans]